MAGTRSSARQAGNNAASSPPQSAESNKRKATADPASSPASGGGKKKRGRPSKADKEAQQKTLEETMPTEDGEPKDTDLEAAIEESKAEAKDADLGAAIEESKKDSNGDVEMTGDNGAAANEVGGDDFKRPDGCWFWLDGVKYPGVAKANGEGVNPDGQEVLKNGDEFEGKTNEGEDKSDPEKSLKDSRGGAGVNVVEGVKAEEGKQGESQAGEENEEESKAGTDEKESVPNAFDQVKADTKDVGKTHKDTNGHADKPATNGDASYGPAVEEDKMREDAQPSNLLEKGLIYFFTRGRVGVEDPSSPQDLARSYFVLRPLAPGAKLSDGAVQDVSNNRLIALPKKVWPKSGRDRFMCFVEKANVGMDLLKEEFFAGSDYETKTVGTRHSPAVTPVGEGVYAITTTGGGQGTTHLSYMLTIPTELGEVQTDVGLAEKGAFVLSLKNPEAKGPANATLPHKAAFSKEIQEAFEGRGWMPAKPEHFAYENAQVLLIGEKFEKSVEGTKEDEQSKEKETPAEELEKLEHEDDLRVEHLAGNDTVFADLGIDSKDYPKVLTTW